jgi:hypothetical protein
MERPQRFLELACVLQNTGAGAYSGAGRRCPIRGIWLPRDRSCKSRRPKRPRSACSSARAVMPDGGVDKPLTKPQVLAKAGPLIKG